MTTKNIRLDIQGLRAIAVLSVMLFHANETFLPSGFLGVDIFFVISGFIVTYSITQQSQTFSFVQFLQARIKRILPAYFVLLILTTITAIILLLPNDFRFFYKSLKSASYFASNNYFATFGDYFAPSSNTLPLLHTWSLAIEMQFYLLLSLMFLLPKKYWKQTSIGLLGISLLILAYLNHQSNEQLYFLLWGRIPEFLVGVTLALYINSITFQKLTSLLLSLLAILILTVSFFIFPKSAVPSIWVIVIPCLAVAILIASQHTAIHQVLSSSVLVWVGNLSYSLYLFHWIILAFMRYVLDGEELQSIHYAIYFILSFALAAFSYHYIENTIRQQKGKKAFIPILALLLTLILLIVTGSKLNKTLIPPPPVEQTQYADGNLICHGKIVGDCLQGDNSQASHTLVIGDSHTAQLNRFFEHIGQVSQSSFTVISASSCIPIQQTFSPKLQEWARNACQQQIDYLTTLNQDHFKNIIIAGKWSYQTEFSIFQKDLHTFIQKKLDKGVRVIVLAQVPMLEKHPLRVQRFNQLFQTSSSSSKDSITEQANQTIKTALSDLADYPNFSFADFTDIPLFLNAPFYEGNLLYYDTHHLNEVGSLLYAKEVADKLMKLLH